MDSFYLVLKSNSSENYYQSNNSTQFKNKLLNNISLEGTWSVALCDIQIFKPKKVIVGHSLWVYTDIVNDTQVGNISAPLLRRITVSNLRKNWLICEIENLYYMKLRSNFIESIRISIKEDINKIFDSFKEGDFSSSWDPDKETATTLTLHFKRVCL